MATRNLTFEEAREAGFVPKPSPPRGRTAATSKPPSTPAPHRNIADKRPTPTSSAQKAAEKSTKEKRVEAAQTALGLVSTGLMMVGMGTGRQVLLDDAGAFAVHAEDVGRSAADYAEQNAFVAGILDRLELFNGVAALALTLMPLTLQIMVNHRATTPEGAARVEEMGPALQQFGVLPPEMLRAKVASEHKRKLAEMQADLLRAQHAAETQLADLKNEMGQD